MKRKRKTVYDQKIIEALERIPFPIFDKRHNLTVCLYDGRARSNEGRFEHISKNNHKLSVKDIEYIPEGLVMKSKLKQDPIRKNTFNYYIPRKGDIHRFIKVCVEIVDEKQRIARIKTIFITSAIK